MGFLSKLWKGVKKTFKKIFKPIKKVFKTIGKFVNKLGIVGQIAMMFIPIPGLSTLFSGLGKMGSEALGWLTGKGAIGSAAASVIGSAAKFAGAVAKPFVNITKGVTGFVKNLTKFTLNKIPGINIASAPTSIFGEGGAWSQASEAITTSFKDFKGDIASAASMDISDILPKSTKGLIDPVKATFPNSAPDKGLIDPVKATFPNSAPEAVVPDSKLPDVSQPVLDVQPSASVSDGVVGETVSTETKSFLGNMKDKMLAPYKEFAGDPLGTIGEKTSDFVAQKINPVSLLMRPDTPEALKNFKSMYISQQKASDKYANITTSPSQFVQQMSNLGLLQGGFEPMPNPMMGWGSSTYAKIMENSAPSY